MDEVTLAEPSRDISASYVELAVYPPMTNTLSNLPREPKSGEIVLLQIGPNTVRQVVVQRDDDMCTLAQLKEFWPEVKKAMLNELQTWAKLKCFSRKPRSSARNVIDVRWVIKFKWDVATSASGSRSTEARTPVRTIRARLGFMVSRTSRRPTSTGMLEQVLVVRRSSLSQRQSETAGIFAPKMSQKLLFRE